MKEKLKIKRTSESAIIPVKATGGAAGIDLCIETEGTTIFPGESLRFGTGIAVRIPEGYAGLIFARSGLSSRYGIRPSTCVSVIDSDYRGEMAISLHNDSTRPYSFIPHERVAQLLVVPVADLDIEEVDELDATDRGAGGFGSTGR